MGVSGRHDIRAGSVDPGVNGESCAVDRMLPFHHLAMVVYQNQIGDTNLAKVHAERIDPEMIETLGVAGGNVSGDAFIKSEAREQAEGAGQALFAVLALFGDSSKCWRSENVERVLRGHGRRRLLRLPHKYSAGARSPQRERGAKLTHGLRRRLNSHSALRLKSGVARVITDYPLGHATRLGLGLTFLALHFQDD